MICSPVLCCLLMTLVKSVSGDDVADPNFFPRRVGDYIPQNCWNFTYGDRNIREFYSPKYPQNYMNETSCIQQLVAPSGYRIRLDFRDDFEIEESDGCKYDFLELRNGPYGYSPLIGRFCGKQHPPMIESSNRYLWIRFQSDDSIEYRGFRAVYDFFVPGLPVLDFNNQINSTGFYDYGESFSDNVCRIDVDVSNHDGFISSTDVPQAALAYSNRTGNPVDCTWHIYTPPGYRTWIQWKGFRMTTTESCEDSFVEMYDRTTATADRRSLYCGNTNRNVRSHSNLLYMRAFAEQSVLLPYFEALFTLYTTSESNECPQHTFRCEQNICINDSLVCNGRDNCRPANDEYRCRIPGQASDDWGSDLDLADKFSESETTMEPPLLTERHLTILGVVSGWLLVAVAIAVYVTCKQHKKETIRRQHALKQEDRRNNVELTNLLHHQGESPRRMHGTTPGQQMGNHTRRNGSLERTMSASIHNVPNHMSSSIPNHSAHNGYAMGHHRAGSCKSEGAPVCYPKEDLYVTSQSAMDPIAGGSGSATFRRFLTLDPHEDEDSSPNVSYNQIPAVVTIERGESNGGMRSQIMNRRDNDGKNYKGRPDLVRNAGYLHTDGIGGPLKRDLSAEFNQTDSNDTWKYLSNVTTVVPPNVESRDPKENREEWFHSMGRSVKHSKNNPPLPAAYRREHLMRSKSTDRADAAMGQSIRKSSGRKDSSNRSLDDAYSYYPDGFPHYSSTRHIPDTSRRSSPGDGRRTKSPSGRRTSPRRQKSMDELVRTPLYPEHYARQDSWKNYQSQHSKASHESPKQFYSRPRKPTSNPNA